MESPFNSQFNRDEVLAAYKTDPQACWDQLCQQISLLELRLNSFLAVSADVGEEDIKRGLVVMTHYLTPTVANYILSHRPTASFTLAYELFGRGGDQEYPLVHYVGQTARIVNDVDALRNINLVIWQTCQEVRTQIPDMTGEQVDALRAEVFAAYTPSEEHAAELNRIINESN